MSCESAIILNYILASPPPALPRCCAIIPAKFGQKKVEMGNRSCSTFITFYSALTTYTLLFISFLHVFFLLVLSDVH